MTPLPRDLHKTLDILAATAEALELGPDWIVFGGAATALSGLPDWPVPDIDILASEDATEDLIEAFGGRMIRPQPDDRFRSRMIGQIDGLAVPIEIMVGLEVRTDDGWTPVRFATRVERPIGDRSIPTASTQEQGQMARRFGRPKDLQRAEALEKLATR